MSKSPEAFRTISEVAEWLETPAHVLRFWESKFAQVKPVKRAGGRRYYRPADMVLLGGIKKLLHDDGMTIKGAQKIIREQGVRYVSSLCDRPLDGVEGTPDAPFAEVEEAPSNPQLIAFPGGASHQPEPSPQAAKSADTDTDAEEPDEPALAPAVTAETEAEPEAVDPPAAAGPVPEEPVFDAPEAEAAEIDTPMPGDAETAGTAPDPIPAQDADELLTQTPTETEAPAAAAPDAPEPAAGVDETDDGSAEDEDEDALPLFTRRPSADRPAPESPPQAAQTAELAPESPAEMTPDSAETASEAASAAEAAPAEPAPAEPADTEPAFDTADPGTEPATDHAEIGAEDPEPVPGTPSALSDDEPSPAATQPEPVTAPTPPPEAAPKPFVAREPAAPVDPPAPGPLSHLAGIDELSPDQAEALAAALPALEAVVARLSARVHV